MSLIGLLDYFDRKSGREQYGNLLDEYRVPGDPNVLPLGNTPAELDQSILQQQGGFKGEGGLLTGGPPPEFYLRAGGLPGYQQMAQQAQIGQQAMERQQQGQAWEANNMSLAQKTAADAQAQRDKWSQERQVYEYANPSAYQSAQIQNARAQTGISAGHLGLAQQQFGLQQQEFAARQQQAQNQAAFPALGLKPEQQMEYRTTLANLDKTANVVTDTLDYLKRVGVGEKALDRPQVNAMNAEYRQQVIPYFQKKFQAGALQKGDMEFIESVAADPGGVMSLDHREKIRLSQILRSVEDDRQQMYGLGGYRAPPTRAGQSAWARSQSARSAPDDIQWTPAGP
jgi:hypothetical protein